MMATRVLPALPLVAALARNKTNSSGSAMMTVSCRIWTEPMIALVGKTMATPMARAMWTVVIEGSRWRQRPHQRVDVVGCWHQAPDLLL
jgi:hypothetical protein